jgi:hypothetical protein
MGSHDPFGPLKHKLWPKERPWFKLAIWLSIIKSQELTRFTCVQVLCNMPLEISWQGLELCFRPHLNPRSAHKVMGPQSCKSSNFGNLGVLLGSPETKCHLDVGLVERYKIYYKGEGGGFSQVRVVVNLVSPSCPWFVLAPKVFQLCTNHFVLVLCKSVWVVKAYQFFLVHTGAPAHPSTPPKCCEPGSVPWLLTLSLSSIWDSHLSPSRSWECIIVTVQVGKSSISSYLLVSLISRIVLIRPLRLNGAIWTFLGRMALPLCGAFCPLYIV